MSKRWKIMARKPKNVSYQGTSEKGSLYFRKKDDRYFLKTHTTSPKGFRSDKWYKLKEKKK